jgi:hypothetical protein
MKYRVRNVRLNSGQDVWVVYNHDKGANCIMSRHDDLLSALATAVMRNDFVNQKEEV